MAFLIQVNEGVKSVVLPLCKAVILIGRDEDSNLYLDNSGISKNHASIIFSNDSYILKDNGSSSGSIVNGVRVREHKLAHDDQIQFGPYLFKVDLVNPIPVTTVVNENDVALERSGHSYTRRVQLPEIEGLEKNGSLQVVMADPPKALPPPLPASGFLANLSLQNRQNLSLKGTYRYARPGEVLIKEGLNPGRLFLVISGKWVARKESTNTVLGTIQPGEWVGEVSIFDPQGAVCSVVAAESSEYWEITREAFETFINESRSTGTAILIALAATLGQRIRQSAENLGQATSQVGRRSGLTAVFAAVALIAVIGVAALFLKGDIEKKRFQAEKQQLEQARAGIGEESLQRAAALELSLQEAKEELRQALAKNQELAQKLGVATNSLKELRRIGKAPNSADVAHEETVPPSEAEAAEAATAESQAAGEEMELSGYPSKVIVTSKTLLNLTVDGKVSGKVVLPAGRELTVVGAEGPDLIVEFGDSLQKISKKNTNFAEALMAEAEAAKKNAEAHEKMKQSASNTPPPEDKSAEAAKKTSVSASKPTEVTVEELSSILQWVKLLDTIEDLREIKKASNSEISRFMRTLESRWKRASSEAAQLLSTRQASGEVESLLKKIIEASEMRDPSRLEMFDSKLKDIDKEFLKLRTEQKIQNLTDSPRE